MKNRIVIPALSLVLFGLITIFFNNCGITNFTNKYQITSIGNPLAPVAKNILFSVCGVINRCNPQVTIDSCESGVLKTAGFATPLGLSASYDIYSDIVQGELTGALTGNTTSASGCYDSINTLSCSDANVQAAYNPSLPNPYSNTPNLIPMSQCDQVYTPGVNLEVPIEMSGQGMASNTTSTTFSRTRTSLNTTDYDGTVTYYFEIVANNLDTISRNVSLVDANGVKVSSIVVPANLTGASQRFRSQFVPTAGAGNYRIQLDGTSSSNQLEVWVGRMIVQQVGATQTKIFVPLMVGGANFALNGDDFSARIDSTPLSTYSASGWNVLWQKNNAAFSQLASGSPWTFEAVLSSGASTTTSYASIFDAATGLQVQDSEVSTTSITPALVTKAFADSALNFNDLDNMQVQIKRAGSSSDLAIIYRAGVWIKLINLAHAEVYYRYLYAEPWPSGYPAQDRINYRVVIDKSRFSGAVSIYNELTSSVSAAGTSCTVSVFDNGLNDTGATGSVVSGSTLTMSSPVVTRQRSPAFSLTSGDRFTNFKSANPGPGECDATNAFIVIGF